MLQAQSNRRTQGLVALVTMTICTMALADQEAIVIDGGFSDWNSVTVTYHDSVGDSGSQEIDFGRLWIADDPRFLFLRFETAIEIDASENNDVRLYLDTDANTNTGLPIAGIGAELEWRFGSRTGTFHFQGTTEIFAEHIRFRGGPTVTSSEFEIAIGRDTLPDGRNPLFDGPEIRVALVDNAGSDRVPDVGEIISYDLDQGRLPEENSIPLSRDAASDLRMITHNVLNDGPWQAGLEPRFGRQWAAVAPDILNFQEIYDHSAAETAQLVSNWVPLGKGESWHAAERSDCITVSRYPILDSWPLDGNLAVLIDTTTVLPTEVLVINAHLPCCGNDFSRQFEIDRIMEFVRDAQTPGGQINLVPDTPIFITGDLNLVGFAQQLTTLVSGDIVNAEFGPEFAPDWDGTEFTNVLTRQTEKRMGYTWRNDNSSFWPGQLDYFIYSDSVIERRNNFVLYTPEMSDPTALGMMPNDSTASDHLLFCTDYRHPSRNILGDVNLDGLVNLLDVAPFVDRLSTGTYQAEADINQDGILNLLDVEPFVTLHSGG